MSRLVEPMPPQMLAGQEQGEAAAPPRGDKYAARVAKYIPGEVLSAYVAMIGIVATITEEPLAFWSAWGAFAVGVIFTPIYLRFLSQGTLPWGLHATISTFAFIIWAYAMGGPFKMIGIHSPQLGSLLLILFTLVVGALRPKA